ncbi:MAG: hypothetical protein AAF939_16665 [Planctomycetota bacterium]
MNKSLRIASRVLIYLVAVVLILAGSLKLIGVGADDMVEGLEKARLIQHLSLISIIAIVCGILLILPLTRKLGVLMASSYWGGAIVAHLTYNDSVVMPATFVIMLWSGVLLGSDWFLNKAAPAEPNADS